MDFIVKVEEGEPPSGHVFRCTYAKDEIFDAPSGFESPWQFFSDSVFKNPDNPMLGKRETNEMKEPGQYTWVTYKDVYDAALKMGSAMRMRNVNPGDHCGIYGSNCPEWVIAMQACNSQAITYVPLYDTLGSKAVEFIINHAEISVAFVHENKLPAILSCLAKCRTLKTIISFKNLAESQINEAESFGAKCFSWDEFSYTGSVECDLPPKSREDVGMIMYTSGTTGEPKGAILKNKAFMSQVLSVEYVLEHTDRVVTEEDCYFSFLPLAHIYDQVMETYCFYKGASVGFWSGDPMGLLNDVQELKPTIFCGVPRIFGRIYNGTKSRISSGGFLKKTMFDFAYNYKLGNLEKGWPQAKAAPLFDSLVFEKTKQILGGRIRILISGAAPLPLHVEEFMRVTACSTLSQGYGLTETCGGCFASTGDVYPMLGTVGVPMPTVEFKLESLPEMGYDASSDVARGEICVRGSILFSGYHKREDLTNEVLVNGWFHTGDIGEIQPNGSMKIIDRKKNIFKLSQGEYVAVENLENVYSSCPLISSIWVYGNSQEAFLVAIVVPEPKALEDWAANNGIKGDFKSLCENKGARDYIRNELNTIAQNHQLKGFEMMKAIHLEPKPFDVERDLVTPTLKLKRPQLYKYYKNCIDDLYKEGRNFATKSFDKY